MRSKLILAAFCLLVSVQPGTTDTPKVTNEQETYLQIGLWPMSKMTPAILRSYLKYTKSNPLEVDPSITSPFAKEEAIDNAREQVDEFWSGKETDKIQIHIENLPIKVDWENYNPGKNRHYFFGCFPSHIRNGDVTVFTNISSPMAPRRRTVVGCREYAIERGRTDTSFVDATIYVQDDSAAKEYYKKYSDKEIYVDLYCEVSHTQNNGIVCNVRELNLFSEGDRVYSGSMDSYWWYQ